MAANFILSIAIMLGQAIILHDFDTSSKSKWQIVDDRVMGGVSQGKFSVDESGNGIFSGDVSTANNGGFSSVRMSLTSEDLNENKNFILKIKGDGKSYQFRVKTNAYAQHSFIYTFETSGDWQEIKIPFKRMFASWRGRRLDMPNYDGSAIEEMRFLIANKKNESFRLVMDWIKVN